MLLANIANYTSAHGSNDELADIFHLDKKS